MPATPDRADGARPARGAVALLGGAEAEPLTRVRRGFLALALVACIAAALAMAGVPDRTVGLRVAGIAAVAALALVWLRIDRRGALSPWDEPIELLALFAVGLAVGPEPALAVIYAGLYFRTLYASSRMRAAAGLAVYSVAHVGAVLADGGDEFMQALEHLPPLAIGCAVMHAFAAMLARHERTLQRERTLRDASAALVDARDRAAVYAAAMTAVERLGDGRSPAAVIALASDSDFAIRAATGPWLPGIVSSRLATTDLPSDLIAALERGRPYVIESPRLAGLELYAPPELGALEGVCLPLSVRGESRGFLAVFCPAAESPEEIGALTALAGEAALAIAAAEADDSAADDRSLARLTASSRE